MEFASIKEGKFEVDKAPNAYPSSNPDRDGNYSSSDVDYSKTGTSTPGQIEGSHARADTDTSRRALHHTLGVQRNQASPGDHIHDGRTSKKIGDGLGLTISGSRGGNAAVASIIAMLKQVMVFTDNTTP